MTKFDRIDIFPWFSTWNLSQFWWKFVQAFWFAARRLVVGTSGHFNETVVISIYKWITKRNGKTRDKIRRERLINSDIMT